MVQATGVGPAYAGTYTAQAAVTQVQASGPGPAYSGSLAAVTRVQASGSGPQYAGTAAGGLVRVTVTAAGPEYGGTVASTVSTRVAAESGEFFAAVSDQAGAWGAVFPPEVTVPARCVRQAADGLSAVVYAPPSSSGYTFLVTCGPASASVQVQPTSLDDRRRRPVVLYGRAELPLPFDVNEAPPLSGTPLTTEAGSALTTESGDPITT